MTRLVYVQANGSLYAVPDDVAAAAADPGMLIGVGYAGHGAGFNNPAMQNVQDVGPLPQGSYTIGDPHDNMHTGPFTLDLGPDATDQMFGRFAFRIHGDNPEMNHTASDGCIIAAPAIRHDIVNRGLTRLEVVAGD